MTTTTERLVRMPCDGMYRPLNPWEKPGPMSADFRAVRSRFKVISAMGTEMHGPWAEIEPAEYYARSMPRLLGPGDAVISARVVACDPWPTASFLTNTWRPAMPDTTTKPGALALEYLQSLFFGNLDGSGRALDDAQVLSDERDALMARAEAAEANVARLREALAAIEKIAAHFVGSTFAACEGRHNMDRTCAYCDSTAILEAARAALAATEGGK